MFPVSSFWQMLFIDLRYISLGGILEIILIIS